MKGRYEPTKVESVSILGLALLAQIWEVSRTVGWRTRASGVLDNVDNASYSVVADFIWRWVPDPSFDVPRLWGYPYAIVAVSRPLGVDNLSAMIALSVGASIGTCLILHRLYGGVTATLFGIISSTWIWLSVFGGCEPLFMFLLFSAFLLARRGNWMAAAALGSLAAAVRPVGVLMPLMLLAQLLWKQDWKAASGVAAVGAAAFFAYAIPVYILTGDPLIQIRLYSDAWNEHVLPMGHGGLLTLPGLRMIQSFFSFHEWYARQSWTYVAQIVGWMLVSLLACLLSWRQLRQRELPLLEAGFALSYSAFLLCYNYDFVDLYINRFVIPELPFLLFALHVRFPDILSRRILWPVAAGLIVFNTVLLFGAKTVLGFRIWGISV